MPEQILLTRYESRDAQSGGDLGDLSQLAREAGMHPDLVHRLYELGLIEAERRTVGEPLFAPSTIVRLRRMARLHRDLRMTWSGLGLVADLLERIDSLQSRIRTMEANRSRR